MISDNYIDIKECDDIREWSSDLLSFNFSIFQTEEWILSVSESQNLTPVFLDLFIENEKRGKISGVISTSKLWGRQIYFYSGPALKDEDYNLYKALTKVLLKYSNKNKYSRLIIGSYGAVYSPEITTNYFHSFNRKEFIVSLESNPGKNYSRNFRRKIKKAIQLSPEITDSKTDTGIIESYLKSTLTYRKKHDKDKYNPLALPHLTYDVINSLLDLSFAKTYSIETNLKAGGFLMTIENYPQASALLTGIDDELYEHGISAYLYNFVLKLLYNNGFKQLNLGGIPEGAEGKALAQFKKSMGAEEITVYGATTNFLTYPYKLLNPILNIGRKMPKNNAIVKFLKKFV